MAKRSLPEMSESDRRRLENQLGDICARITALMHFFCGPEAVLKRQLTALDLQISEEFLKAMMTEESQNVKAQNRIPTPHIPTKEEQN